MVIKTSIIVIILTFMLTGCLFGPTKPTIVEIPVGVPVCDVPPEFLDNPALASDQLTEEQMNDLGELAKYYKANSILLMENIKSRTEWFNRCADIQKAFSDFENSKANKAQESVK